MHGGTNSTARNAIQAASDVLAFEHRSGVDPTTIFTNAMGHIRRPVTVLRGWCEAGTNPESGTGSILFFQRVLPIRKRAKPIHSMREAPTGCMRFRIGFCTGLAQPESLHDG
jgi:hypothetical protein